MKVHHIGYFVDDIHVATDIFCKLNYFPTSEVVFDEHRKAYMQLVKSAEVVLELIEPVLGSSLVNLHNRYRNSPYHICYSCDSISSTVQHLRSAGFLPISGIEESTVFSHCRVCFLMHKYIGMVELLEEDNI